MRRLHADLEEKHEPRVATFKPGRSTSHGDDHGMNQPALTGAAIEKRTFPNLVRQIAQLAVSIMAFLRCAIRRAAPIIPTPNNIIAQVVGSGVAEVTLAGLPMKAV